MPKLPTWLTHWYTYRGAVGIISGLVLALLMFGLYAIDFPGVHPEDRFFAEDSPPASDVVIVGIDDKTIAALGHFPFSRDAYAATLTALQNAGASAVVFDVGFSEPYTGDQKFHDALVGAARSKLPVILAYGSADLTYGDHKLIQATRDAGGNLKPTQDELPIRLFRCADSSPTSNPYAPCAQKISESAAANITADSDGVVRRMPIFVEPACHQQGKNCEASINSISVAAYRQYFLQDQADAVQLQWTPQGATFGQAWTKPLWVDDQGQALIHYYGVPGDFERHGQYFSMSDVAAANVPPDKLKGKVVLIGAYNATGLHDEKLVPTHNGDVFMQGIEIHANFVSTLQNQLRGGFLQPEPSAAVLLVMLVLGVLMGWVVARLSVVWGAVASAGVLTSYTATWYLGGQEALSIVPNVFHTWLVIAGTYTGVTAYRFLYEDREKRKVTAIFGQYLKPELVQRLAAVRTLDELQLGGERRELSLLFCDIRGFTSMSETMPAEDVVQVATEYLSDLTSIIFKWDGTIDKYVGDEIVAVWNAPHDQREHALLAVRCAYEMISHAPQLQAKLLAMNLPPIRYGIGINTGPAVWGNLGSHARRQFTALGDTVNTAARFCGAAGPFELLIGEPTYELCKDHIAVEMAPGIQLKGKSAETFKIYRVVAIRESATTPWVPFPTEMAAQVTYTHTQQYRTQQTMMSAGATVSMDAATRELAAGVAATPAPAEDSS
jgi:adenylate cyclase